MRCLAVCLAAMTAAVQADLGRAAGPVNERPYTFTINGLPFLPRVFSLRGAPEHPVEGDLIAFGTMLMALGPQRDCRFVIPFEKDKGDNGLFQKVFLRRADGRERVMGVRVFSVPFADRKKVVFNPLASLSADEIHGLWGIYLGAWSEDIAERLRHIDPARACITIGGGALIDRGKKKTLPPLPQDIRYLNTEGLHGNVENGEPLRQWTRLRFLRLDGRLNCPFDVRWLARNRELRRLDLNFYALEHAEALSDLEELETLDLHGSSSLATLGFAGKLNRLRSLTLAETNIGDLSGLGDKNQLARLDAHCTKVGDLSHFTAENLEEINVSRTMVESLAPLGKFRRLAHITASDTSVDKLPERPMPALRTLIAASTRLSRASLDAFARLNPHCAVILGRTDQFRWATAGATRLRIRSGAPGTGAITNCCRLPIPIERCSRFATRRRSAH